MKIIRIIVLIIVLIACYFLFIWAINPDAAPTWTGFGNYNEVAGVQRSKTLWEWLDLLLIPFVVGIIAWSFKEAEKETASKSEYERSQNETLDSFVNIMTELITKHNLANKSSSLETKIIARTRINLAFSNLNGARKGQVLQFLFESGLIDYNPKINIIGGNMKNTILDGIVLSKSEIKGVYFNNATIKEANLNEAIFTSCDFTKADLSKSLVINTNFSYTNLTKSKLKNMDLTSVNFEGANLTKADLRGSKIRQEQLNTIFNKEGIKTTKSKII
jgi:uncharacterized protein YjbI with pentapeptide repeats